MAQQTSSGGSFRGPPDAPDGHGTVGLSGPGFPFPPGSAFLPPELAPPETAAISTAILTANAFCGGLADKGYVVDCLAYHYGEIADALPDSGGFAPIKASLQDTSDKLSALVESAPARDKPLVRAQRQDAPGSRTRRALRAIDPARADSINQEAARIIEQGQTVLLRSVGNLERRRAQYQRVAQAMNGGAVLLRSL